MMHWALTGLLLLVSGSLFAVQATWPGGAGERPRTGVSLSEFQNGLRIDRLRPPTADTAANRPRRADTLTNPAAPASAGTGLPGASVQPGAKDSAGQDDARGAETSVFAMATAHAQPAEQAQPVVARNGSSSDQPRPPGPDTAAAETAVDANPPEAGPPGPQAELGTDPAIAPAQTSDAAQAELSAPTQTSADPETVVTQDTSGAGAVQPSGSPTTPATPRPGDNPAVAAVPDQQAPEPAATAAAETPPPAGSPALETQSAAIASPPLPDERPMSAAGPAIGPAPAQHAEPPRSEPAFRPGVPARHADRISIHHRVDERSRIFAHWVLVKLESTGLSTIEMHTTAHAIPAPTVRYFSAKDAPAAVSLAKALGTGSIAWRVEDCTGYRHKPEPGTLQIWPATAERRAK